MKVSIKPILSLFILFLLLITEIQNTRAYTSSPQQDQDVFEEFTDTYVPGSKNECHTCSSVETCQSENKSVIPLWMKFGVLLLIATAGAIYITRKFNWKIAALLLALFTLGFVPPKHFCTKLKPDSEDNFLSINKITSTSINVLGESKEAGISDTEDRSKTSAETDEFIDIDEFEAFNEEEDMETSTNNNEFSSFTENAGNETSFTTESIWKDKHFTTSLFVLFLTLVAGILVRFKSTRKLKIFILLGSIIYLGFINGACPCMISSFQNTILYTIGEAVNPLTLVWFLGLIPLTYFFGKVWCGWVCHLGALQEFLFRPGVVKILQDRKSQMVLKWIRIATLVLLIIQILVTRSNIFIHYDPFKVAYNLFSANVLGYVLLGLLLISSVLIYRPFCRAICPVGLILGWISTIPGATKLSKNDTCIDCKRCSNSCRYNAMTYENKKSLLRNDDCIMCGDCMDSCHINSMEITGISKI